MDNQTTTPIQVRMSVIPIKGLKPGCLAASRSHQRRPNERHPDQGIETQAVARTALAQCRPNERHPDQGIETPELSQNGTEVDLVRMSVIPIKGLKLRRGPAVRRWRASGPNERHPDQGIETRCCSAWTGGSRTGPNERHPDQGIETCRWGA